MKKEAMTQGLENTISNGQGAKPHSAIEKACTEGPGICAIFLTLGSILMIVATLPMSLFVTIKVVQEYERAVIFRLGRLLSGGARGPGVVFIIFIKISVVIKINYIDFRFTFVQVFFIIPCVDIYEKIDMRTATYEIPPQEVRMMMTIMTMMRTMRRRRRRRMITIIAKKS